MANPISDEKKVVYKFLGRSGLKVSNINLGCMTFGESAHGFPAQCDENLSHQILNRFSEWGGNFLDTADVYGNGKSEEILGRWIETQPRDKYVIATKVRINMGVEQNVNNVGLSRRHITESIDRSLQRLHTDFVDLYQTHAWDDATPLEETLRTLDDLIRVGKIRYVGVSNVTGWQLQKLASTTKELGLNPITSLQQQYSLIDRDSELEPFQVCKIEGIGVLPWSPLKSGILTGKVKRGVKPTEGRASIIATVFPHLSDFSDRTFDIIDVVEDIAKKYESCMMNVWQFQPEHHVYSKGDVVRDSENKGRSIPQVAIRWLLQKDVVTSVIIGARTLAQLDDNMAAANGWSLTKEEMQRLDDVSSRPLPYPYSMIFGLNKERQNPSNSDFYIKSTV